MDASMETESALTVYSYNVGL